MDIMFICSSYGRKLSTKDHHETVKDNSRIDLVGSGYALALNPCASASEFVYDDQGKLTEVSFVDGTRIIYIHDANGNRIKKIFDSGTGEFFTISAAAGPGGKIRPSWATVGAGGSQTFTISPSAGCHIEDVRVDGTSIGPVSSYTFSYVSSDHTLEAIFAIDTFTIATSVDNGIGGTINPSSPAVGYGANQSFSIVASPNFTLVAALADRPGSLKLATGAEGAEVQRVTYYPFGEIRTNAGNDPGNIDLAYKFTGQEYDSETGLYYYGAKYYDRRSAGSLLPVRSCRRPETRRV